MRSVQVGDSQVAGLPTATVQPPIPEAPSPRRTPQPQPQHAQAPSQLLHARRAIGLRPQIAAPPLSMRRSLRAERQPLLRRHDSIVLTCRCSQEHWLWKKRITPLLGRPSSDLTLKADVVKVRLMPRHAGASMRVHTHAHTHGGLHAARFSRAPIGTERDERYLGVAVRCVRYLGECWRADAAGRQCRARDAAARLGPRVPYRQGGARVICATRTRCGHLL
jgi:hypothetical protein